MKIGNALAIAIAAIATLCRAQTPPPNLCILHYLTAEPHLPNGNPDTSSGNYYFVSQRMTFIPVGDSLRPCCELNCVRVDNPLDIVTFEATYTNSVTYTHDRKSGGTFEQIFRVLFGINYSNGASSTTVTTQSTHQTRYHVMKTCDEHYWLFKGQITTREEEGVKFPGKVAVRNKDSEDYAIKDVTTRFLQVYDPCTDKVTGDPCPTPTKPKPCTAVRAQ